MAAASSYPKRPSPVPPPPTRPAETHPRGVFEIMGRKGELSAAQLELRARYSDGLAAYRAQRWEDARSGFEAALKAIPGDGPSMAFIKRIDRLMAAPPGDG